MADPTHFDEHAASYEEFRPPYPEAVWRRLREIGVLRDGVRALELGAGTGEATSQLVASGATVTAVEPGPALADRLRRRVPDAEVIVTTAEDVTLLDASLDLAVIATAVHWLDLEVVVPMLHRVLVPGGKLAVLSNVFGDPNIPTPFRQRVAEITARRSGPRRPSGLDADHPSRRLSAGGLFVECHDEVFRWSIDLDAEQVRGLFSTFSDWTSEEAEAAATAVRDLGGQVTEHYLTSLLVLERTGG